jgi:hypothetical protein
LNAIEAGMSFAWPPTPGVVPKSEAAVLPPITSGPIGGNGEVCVAAQEVGNVVQFVQTFHQFKPVPPLGNGAHDVAVNPCKKKEHGSAVVLGIKLLPNAALPVSVVGISELEAQVVDQPGLEELPQ